MSDWGAQEGTLDAVAGLDVSVIFHISFEEPCSNSLRDQMAMAGDIELGSHTSWWGSNLTAYVENGTISDDRLSDMATRILASWYLLGQDENYPAGEWNVSHR